MSNTEARTRKLHQLASDIAMVGFPDSMAEAVEVAVWALALEAELEALRPMGFKEAYLQENEIKALESRCAAQEEALRQCRTSVAGYAITSDRQLQGVVDSFLKESLGGFQAKARVAAWWHDGEIDIDNFDGHPDQCLAWIVRELGQIEVA